MRGVISASVEGSVLVREDGSGRRDRTDQVGFEKRAARDSGEAELELELEFWRGVVEDNVRSWCLLPRRARKDWCSAFRQWLHICKFIVI